MIAEVASCETTADHLFALVRRSACYATLNRAQFDAVLDMICDGFQTSRGRRGAFIHRDETTGRLRGRRGARLSALTGGGAIAESFDYDVVLEPTELRIGSLHEDFAIESSAGDVF